MVIWHHRNDQGCFVMLRGSLGPSKASPQGQMGAKVQIQIWALFVPQRALGALCFYKVVGIGAFSGTFCFFFDPWVHLCPRFVSLWLLTTPHSPPQCHHHPANMLCSGTHHQHMSRFKVCSGDPWALKVCHQFLDGALGSCIEALGPDIQAWLLILRPGLGHCPWGA